MDEALENAEGAGQQRQFPCSNCGANLQFEPGMSVLKCPYCQTENQVPRVEDAAVEEQDFHAVLSSLQSSAETQETLAVKCVTCGAESQLQPNVTADRCPFCGSAIVAGATSHRAIKPKSLLPFHVRREESLNLFRRWIDSLWFAPNDLKKYSEAGSLKGVYIPYWTYDSDTFSQYRGQRGDNYTTTESYTAFENGKSVRRTRTVTKIRWRSVSGSVSNSFDDVLVLAAESLPRAYTDQLEPWDLQNLQPYQEEYLAGFVAESYTVDVERGFVRAKEIMDGHIRTTIKRDIGGDHQRIHWVSTHHENITFKHILLPLWISAYRYHQRTFRFLVNARTGEVCGERPYSAVKIILMIMLALSVIAAIYLFTQAK